MAVGESGEGGAAFGAGNFYSRLDAFKGYSLGKEFGIMASVVKKKPAEEVFDIIHEGSHRHSLFSAS